MNIRVFINIEGDIDAFVKAYTPPESKLFNINQAVDNAASLYFDKPHFDEIRKVEEVVLYLQKQGKNIIHEKRERVLNFEDIDFENRQLIRVSFSNVENLTGLKEFPILTKQCEAYNHLIYVKQNLQSIDLVLWDYFSWLEKFGEKPPLVFSNLVNFAHAQLLEELQDKGMTQGLRTLNTNLYISDEDTTKEKEYYWVYSDDSIGNLTGNVTLGKYNPNCQHPEIIKNNNLIETYSQKNYQGQDFCISNYSGVGSLYISQRVYQFFKEKIKSKKIPKDMISFYPIDLV